MELTDDTLKKFMNSFNLRYNFSPLRPMKHKDGKIYGNKLIVSEKSSEGKGNSKIIIEGHIFHQNTSPAFDRWELFEEGNLKNTIGNTIFVYLGAQEVTNYFEKKSLEYTKDLINSGIFIKSGS